MQRGLKVNIYKEYSWAQYGFWKIAHRLSYISRKGRLEVIFNINGKFLTSIRPSQDDHVRAYPNQLPFMSLLDPSRRKLLPIKSERKGKKPLSCR